MEKHRAANRCYIKEPQPNVNVNEVAAADSSALTRSGESILDTDVKELEIATKPFYNIRDVLFRYLIDTL